MYIEIKNKDGYNLLTKDKVCREDIEVKPLLQSKEVTESGTVTPDAGFAGLEKVTVNVASGASLNIAYGSTAPEDTTKLWVNGAEPSKVIATNQMNGSETLSLVNAYLPSGRYGVGCASVGDYVYFFGGRIGSTSVGWTNQICKLNTKTNTITTLSATLTNICEGVGCASVGTNIYIFGGGFYYNNSNYAYHNKIYKLDTTTDTLTILSTTLPVVGSSMNSGFAHMGCVAVGTNIYLFGGDADRGDYFSRYYSNAILKFDTTTETITTLSATLYTYGISYMGCALVGSDIYIMGGRGYSTTSSSGSFSSSSIRKFDTITETVTTLSETLRSAMSGLTAQSIGTDIYIFGMTGDNRIEKFDTITKIFTPVPNTVFTRTGIASSAIIGTDIYLTNCSTTYDNSIHEFAVAVELPQNQLLLNTTLNKNLFKIINAESAEIEIGVNGVYRGNANNIAELETACVFDETQSAWIDVQSGAVVHKIFNGYNVTIANLNNYTYDVYDGTDANGTFLGTLGFDLNDYREEKTFVCKTGNLYVYADGTNAMREPTLTGGVTVANQGAIGGDGYYVVLNVTADGTADLELYLD